MTDSQSISALLALNLTPAAPDAARAAWARYLTGTGTYAEYLAVAGKAPYADLLAGKVLTNVSNWIATLDSLWWPNFMLAGAPVPLNMNEQKGYFFDALITQYSVTKDLVYLDAYVGYVTSFIRHGLDQTGRSIALALGEFANHVFNNLAQAMSAAPAEQQAQVLQTLSGVANAFLESYLGSRTMWQKGLYWASLPVPPNQAVWLYQAMLKFAYAFGEGNPGWGRLKDDVGFRLTSLLDASFAKDGGAIEKNAAYMFLTLGQLKSLREVYLASAPSGPDPAWLTEFNQDLRLNELFVAAVASPWGELPSLGGTFWVPSPAPVPPGKHLAQASIALPYSSLYVMRSDQTAKASYLLLDGDGPTRGHHDSGVNQIQLAAGGQRLLVNGGYDLYAASTPNKVAYFSPASTWKANTILVDGQSQQHQDQAINERTPDPARWANTARFTYAEGTFAGAYGTAQVAITDVTHQRKVIYDSAHKVYIVVDVLDGGQHTYNQVWKLAPQVTAGGKQISGFTASQVTVDPANRIIRTSATYPGAENLEIRQFGAAIQYESFFGSGDSPFGWFNASKNGWFTASADVHANITADGPVVVISVLIPFGGGPGEASPVTGVSTAPGSPGSVVLTFGTGGTLAIAAAVDPGTLSVAGTTRTLADLLVVSTSAAGTATLVTGDPAYRTSSYIDENGTITLIASPDDFAWTETQQGSGADPYTEYTEQLYRDVSNTGWSPTPTGSSIARGTAGADRMVAEPRGSTLYGLDGNDTLIGSAAADILFGGNGNDSILGGAGNDLVIGGAGADTIDGGDGIDTVDYSVEPNPSGNREVLVNLGDRSVNIWGIMLAPGQVRDNFGGGPSDVLRNIENVIGVQNKQNYIVGSEAANVLTGGAAADTLIGNGGNDTLIGNAGADTLTGGTGDDVLVGGAGADAIDGGAGIDTVDYARELRNSATQPVWVNLDWQPIVMAGKTVEAGQAWDSYGNADRLVGIENVIGIATRSNYLNGSAEANALAGGQFADLLLGQGGNDTLVGAAGTDTLAGGWGDDLLVGGDGADTLDGGDGIDTVDYSREGRDAATLPVWVNLDSQDVVMAKVAVQAGQAVDSFGDRDSLIGIENVIGLAGLANYINGSSAANRLVGGNVADELRGLDGNDTLVGGFGDDTLDGGAGDDWLDAGDGNDLLAGGAGNDTLMGGFGVNTLSGGEGSDRFVVFGAGASTVTITDFAAGDRIDISSASFHSLSALRKQMREVNGDTVITLDYNSSVTVKNALLLTHWNPANFTVI